MAQDPFFSNLSGAFNSLGKGASQAAEFAQSVAKVFNTKSPEVKNTSVEPSLNAKVLNNGGFDPIQGFDVGIFVKDEGSGQEILLGQFNTIEVLVKIAAEPYKAVGYNMPIYLDGEIQITFTLEKGLLDINVLEETLGFSKFSYKNGYFRTPRLEIRFVVDPVDAYALSQPSKGLFEYKDPSHKSTSEGDNARKRMPSGQFVLREAKIEEWGIGARAGRQVVVNQWRGVAQEIDVTQPDKIPEKPADIKNKPRQTPTFYFNTFADFATTKPLPQQPSYELFPDWLSPENVLRFIKLAGQAFPEVVSSIDRQLAAYGNTTKSFSTEAAPASNDSERAADLALQAQRSVSVNDVTSLRDYLNNLSAKLSEADEGTRAQLNALFQQAELNYTRSSVINDVATFRDYLNSLSAQLAEGSEATKAQLQSIFKQLEFAYQKSTSDNKVPVTPRLKSSSDKKDNVVIQEPKPSFEFKSFNG